MQYRDIEAFLEIVRMRSISKAAERLFLSQSVLSTRLKNLETELGFPLVIRERGVRSLQLTPQGEEFVPIAQRWKNLLEEMELLSTSTRQGLHIASNESAYLELLQPFMVQTVQQHPEIRFSLQIKDSADIYTLLEKGLLDFGVASYEASSRNIYRRLLYEQNYCIVCAGTPSGKPAVISPEELDPAQEIGFLGSDFPSITLWHDRHFGKQNQSAMLVNTPQIIIPFLKKPGSWALFPSGMANHIQDKVQVCQLSDPPEPRKIYLLTRNDPEETRTEAAKWFEQALLAYVSR